jgi:glycosyltransferase involved in cell wall biosynthesis
MIENFGGKHLKSLATMESLKSKIYKDCILATHSSDIAGPPDHLITYLSDKTNYFVVIKFPLSPQDKIKPYYEVFKDGVSIEKRESSLILKPFVLNFIKDFFLTVKWSLKLSRKYKFKTNIFFGCNNFLAVAGQMVRVFKKIPNIVFYSVDYSDTRFGNKFLNSIYLWIDKRAAVKSDFVWSNTNRTRAIRREQGVKEEANVLATNGVWLDKIKIVSSKLQVPSSKNRIIRIEYHGYIAESKGIQNVVKALEEIGNQGFILDIIGYGPYEEELKSLVSKSAIKDRINFLGKKQNSEILAVLNSYDLCINLINPKEDYLRYCDPMKIREALSANLPVLLSSLPEVAETVRELNLGLVVEGSEDIEEIKGALNKVFKNPEILEEFKKNISKIRTNFDWNNIYGNALKDVK